MFRELNLFRFFTPGLLWTKKCATFLCHTIMCVTQECAPLGHLLTLIHSAADGFGLHACHSVRAEQRRAENKRKGGVKVNFGCMTCGVSITIFSAAVLRYVVCSISIYCRERGEAGAWLCEEGRRSMMQEMRTLTWKSTVEWGKWIEWEHKQQRTHRVRREWLSEKYIMCTVFFFTAYDTATPECHALPLLNHSKKHQIYAKSFAWETLSNGLRLLLRNTAAVSCAHT